MARIFRWIAAAGLVLALAAAGLAFWGYERFTAPGPLERQSALVIPKGLNVAAIGRRLEAGGVIADWRVFALAVQLWGKPRALRAGEFAFPAHASAREAMNVLIYAKPVVRRLTVAEGLSTAQVLTLLAHTEGLEGAVKEPPLEGRLLPETYNYSWGDSREELVERMAKAMAATLDQLWRARAPDSPLAGPEAALVLASIVEKETARPEERPRIAEVFLHRLRLHMRLQSDPTVVYALTEGKAPLGRALSRADLEYASAYNTYTSEGLPPGPIDNPGKASLEAVLHPAATNELYFVADGSGGHVFARTLAEHNRNVARLRQSQGREAQP